MRCTSRLRPGALVVRQPDPRIPHPEAVNRRDQSGATLRSRRPIGVCSPVMKTALRWLLTVFMVIAGLNHFLSPDAYVVMVPSALPAPLALVQISGVAEILGGLGLVLARTRRAAGWGLIALLVAVFPANLNMAVNHLPLAGHALPGWALWGRLPLQLVLIAWAHWYTRPQAPAPGRHRIAAG
jgi:uncharacterized membrane protein